MYSFSFCASKYRENYLSYMGKRPGDNIYQQTAMVISRWMAQKSVRTRESGSCRSFEASVVFSSLVVCQQTFLAGSLHFTQTTYRTIHGEKERGLRLAQYHELKMGLMSNFIIQSLPSQYQCSYSEEIVLFFKSFLQGPYLDSLYYLQCFL